MQGMSSGVRGRHRWRRRSRRCRSSPRSTSNVRGFAFGRGGLRGIGVILSLVRAVGYALGCDVVWLGYALEGGRCVRRFARCVLRGGRRWMQGMMSGVRRRHRLPALEKMPQLTWLDLGGARIRFWARASGSWGVGVFGACCSGTLAGGGWVRRFASGVLRGAAMGADQSDPDDYDA